MTHSCLDIVFPSVHGRDVLCCFDGGDLTSDAGLALVALADSKLGLTESMVEAVCDRRQQSKVKHSVLDILRERIYAIAAGYEDADDLDTLGNDPALKTACDRLPVSGLPLASQPTISRLENAIGRL